MVCNNISIKNVASKLNEMFLSNLSAKNWSYKGFLIIKL